MLISYWTLNKNKPDDFILALVQVPKSKEFTEGDVWKVKES
jgi:hypothetical protein